MNKPMKPETWDHDTARDIQRFAETMAEACDAIAKQFSGKGDYDSMIRSSNAHQRGQAFWVVRNMIEEELHDQQSE